jgi:hypothetical protein
MATPLFVSFEFSCQEPKNKVGQNHNYIRCIYSIFGRELTKYTVIYGAYIRFWPTLPRKYGGHTRQLATPLFVSF